jgi:hypothetical protein
MQYLLLIYTDETTTPEPGTAEAGEYFQGYIDATTYYRESEVMVGGQPLQGVETATTVRVRDGKAQVTDGPFAETKETLGGYYLLDCKDLDQAIECAGRIPGARFGSIEIRPIMSM